MALWSLLAFLEAGLGQHLFDQALVGAAVQRLADDPFGGADRDVGELTAQAGDGAVALQPDLVAGPGQKGLPLCLGLLPSLLLDTGGDLLSLGYEGLALAPRLFEARLSLSGRVSFPLLDALRRLYALPHSRRARVEHAHDGLVCHQAQNDEEYP